MSFILVILAGVLSVATTIGLAIVIALLTTEARGDVPVLCNRLLDRTAARLPAEMRDRREEWASELNDAAGRPLTQMVIAVRIWRDGRALAQEASAGVPEAEDSKEIPRKGRIVGMTTLLTFLERPLELGRRAGRFLDEPERRLFIGVLFASGAIVAALATFTIFPRLWAGVAVATALSVVSFFVRK